MYKYILKRLIMMIPVIVGVVTIVFIMNRLTPGNPARQLLGEDASEEAVEAMEEELGLNDPILVQYVKYVWNIVTKGDFGISYQTKQPVITEVLARFPTTFMLALVSMAFATIIGIPVGIISATRQYSWIDNCSMVVALAGVSMPNFWQGLMNIIIFSVWLGWLPSTGFYSWQHWILPALTIGTSSAATITRMTRSSMLEVIRQDYIRTARAKGQKEKTIIIHHALKNALIPIITVVGIQFGGLLGGAVLTESVFAIPGLGKFMLDAIKARNYPIVQGGVLFLALVFSFVNLLVDIGYAYIDPRVRSMYRKEAKRPAAQSVAGEEG